MSSRLLVLTSICLRILIHVIGGLIDIPPPKQSPIYLEETLRTMSRADILHVTRFFY